MTNFHWFILYFVAPLFFRKCTHGATMLLSLILSLRSVARIQTGLNSCNRPRQQNSAPANMNFTKLTVSHEANCCGDLSPGVAFIESSIP